MKVSPTVVTLRFAPLDRKGRYIVRYVATIVSDGHLITGAISFDYGTTTRGVSAGVWVLLGIGSVCILAGEPP